MKQITVSIGVFSRIWALRQSDEGSENDILARVLAEPPKIEKDRDPGDLDDGVRDVRSGTHFPEGFEIFRRFKGADLRATASGGVWVLKRDGATYGSLNELSRGVGAGPENAWVGWHALIDGKRQPLSVLRTPESISRRPKKRSKAKVPASEEDLWRDDVRKGLATIEDGRGLLADIYKAVEKVRFSSGRSWPADAAAIVLRTLAENASDSDAYKGKRDLFTMPYGKGAGFWALR